MSEKKSGINIKEILVSAAALAIISGGVTAALAATNALTKDRIDENNRNKETDARKLVIQADEFERQSLTDDGEEIIYFEAIKNGKSVGYVFTTTSTGKSAGLVVMTGISTDGEITGIKITGNNESAGYVDMAIKTDKKNNIIGLPDRLVGKKAEKEFKLGVDVDAVSQATKTSKGIIGGVNKAIEIFKSIAKEGQ
ncbi:MAG: FMN-binding protein [Oscillospiraceae bacterium]|nr:FMN-binding protein [Oscillospiraceae bacterium]MDD4414278.1 FMN-binding protein [Oscillospiraceae bacterium]